MTDKICAACSPLFLGEQDYEVFRKKEYTPSPRECDFCAYMQAAATKAGINIDQSVDLSVSDPMSTPGSQHRCVYWNGALTGFTVTPLANQLFQPRPVAEDTLDDEIISFLKCKLAECLATHEKCQELSRVESVYPTRLLYIDYNKDEKVVKLQDKDFDPTGHYVTLSHCWGNLQFLKLTEDTESLLRRGIAIDRLPKTFQEAIDLCHKMGSKYLWIDSLCIFQDRIEDWSSEAALMQRVYSFARYNIAASSALDGSYGLRFHRPVNRLMPFTITLPENFWIPGQEGGNVQYMIDPDQPFDQDVDLGPLNRRGWVLQERLLSRRVMHFTRSGVYWECTSSIANDIYPLHLPGDSTFHINDSTEFRHYILQDSSRFQGGLKEECIAKLYEGWTKVVYKYSQCLLSVESDRLVAIAGIVRELERITGDNFVFGLWQRYMLPQLLYVVWRWEDVPLDWRAPSWSWASLNATTTQYTHLSCGYGRDKAVVEQILLDHSSSGQIQAASLVLRGKLVEATLRYSSPYNCQVSFKRIEKSIDDSHRIHLDFETEDDTDVVCMAVYEDRCECGVTSEDPEMIAENPRRKKVLGIILLQRSSVDPTKYKRVGVMFLTEEESAIYTLNEESEDTVTII